MPAIDRKNKLLFYPDIRTSGMEYEALEKPGGNVGVVVGRMKYVFDAVCFVYTCRRLIDLSLIAGT